MSDPDAPPPTPAPAPPAARRLGHRRLQRVVAAWAAAGLLLALLQRPLWELLWIGAWLLVVAYAAAGGCFLVAAAWGAWRDRREPSARRGFLAAGGGVLAAALLLTLRGGRLEAAGDEALVRFRFARNRAAYERVVRQVIAGARPAQGSAGGESAEAHYDVDEGPPVRVAFPQPGGILDNWEGIVYDPTGVVATARGWRVDRGRQEFTAPAEVRGLFGGDLVVCRQLDGPWYVCHFT